MKATWTTVQSGAEDSLSWSLFRTELPLAGTPARAPCLSLEMTPSVPQKRALRQGGIPTSHKGKETFCGLPAIEGVPPQGGLKTMVLGANFESAPGWHDVFGLTEPEVTRVTGRFVDGTTVDARVASGTFALLWTGGRWLDKITSYAGDTGLGECSPPRRSEFLNIEQADKSLVAFTCGP